MAATSNFNINIGSEVQSRVAVNSDLGTFISKSISAVIMVAAVATFIYMIYGGVEWVTSGGEKGKLEEARNRITNAILGLAIVAASWAIFRLIDYFFGIGITK